MQTDRHTTPPPAAGFSLLELTLAIGIFGLLVAGAFGLASGALELTREVGEFEKRELGKNRFIQLCRSTFREVPPSARLRLVELEGGRRGAPVQALRIGGHPRAFPMGAAVGSSTDAARLLLTSAVLTARPDGSGSWMVQLYHLDNEQSIRFDEAPGFGTLPPDPVTLLRGVSVFFWRFYDPETREWTEFWDNDALRPGFIELNFQLAGDPLTTRSVFWLPSSTGIPAPPAEAQESEAGASSGDESSGPSVVPATR